ncbi:KilA-N domain-containing protein [Basfia succiniciproducens]|uniref:KilA-N domain-containing protein n=1 Tax=Basfia succiniciproducens TaxID=653940 RepID=UPI0008C61448|nr:KilA-N domain-containing protein [Basfia succiniciproducens]SEP87758.1 KilA-N domain-containing protein [Basfia succiniciproducens]
MTNLSILKTSIRSLDSLYSLTDLHKASGGDEKHKPVLFLRLDQTKDLISEIENDKVQICTLPVKTIRGGKNPSTYACEELALAYAMWISPKFHLVVLRAFLAMHKQQCQPQQLALPEPEKKFILELTEKELKKLCWLWKMAELMRQLIGMVQKPLELLGSRLSGSAWGFSHEYKYPIEIARKILVRATKDIQTDKIDSNGWNNVIHELRRGETNGTF